MSCIAPCKNCVDLNNKCTACNSGAFLNSNNCIATCPTGFYGNTSTQVCDTCDNSCLTCNSSGSSAC